MRQRIYLNDNWEFTPEWTEGFGHRREGEEWDFCETVRLPHTCQETRITILMNLFIRWSAAIGK